ncbi:cytochrome c family protein [Kordiimonas sp. SCSIO 12603]|uniref:c-type cytochrome n=1 Tax=Kordiimonas sp. SCSIO 12603 TaxID=2829596 RepID=UPI002105CB72|nr:cytochrome c family protein [Kordiimonas sp. SCSIO 12603]UTW57657.1 cytochrome c family protein [Kordiimonas sp. SCSIO 12603]
MPMLLKVCTLALMTTFSGTVVNAVDATDTSLSSLGDAAKGKRVFNRCKACHNLTPAKRTRLGPNLDELFGRKAGSAENYKYSKAMLDTDIVWTESTINEWLTKPNAFLPGNKMAFAGIRKEQDRKDLIAFLRQSTAKTE